MTLIRCECCRGCKTVIGLGGMIKSCDACLGVGHVKVELGEAVVRSRVRRVKVKSEEV